MLNKFLTLKKARLLNTENCCSIHGLQELWNLRLSPLWISFISLVRFTFAPFQESWSWRDVSYRNWHFPFPPRDVLGTDIQTSGQKCGGSTGSSTSCCEQHSIWHSQLEWYQTLAFITKKSVKLLEVLKYYFLPSPLQTVSHKAKRKKTTGRTHIHKPQAKHLFPHTFYHFQKVHSMDRPVRSNYSTQTLNFFW